MQQEVNCIGLHEQAASTQAGAEQSHVFKIVEGAGGPASDTGTSVFEEASGEDAEDNGSDDEEGVAAEEGLQGREKV